MVSKYAFPGRPQGSPNRHQPKTPAQDSVGAGVVWSGVGAFMAARIALVTGRVQATMEHERVPQERAAIKALPLPPIHSRPYIVHKRYIHVFDSI